MLRYECPRCENVSSEGLAVGAEPECAKCGAQMVLVGAERPPAPRRAGPKHRPPTPRDPAAI